MPPLSTRQHIDFRTTNGAQALALALAGFEPAVWNRYTPEILEKLGCTARQAWEAGKPGIVEYYFPHSDELMECVAAYDDEFEKLKAPGSEGSTLDVTATDVVRIAVAVLTQRKPFADLWKKVVPKITINQSGAPQREDLGDGAFRVVFPGFATISINDTAALERIGA